MLKMSCLEQFYRASLTEKTILLMACFSNITLCPAKCLYWTVFAGGLEPIQMRTIPSREWLRFFGAFTLGYFALTLSLGITSDMDSGFNELGQLAALVLIPLGFLLLKDKLTSDLIRLFKMIFVVSCFLLISYQVVQIIWHWETVFGAITEAEVIAFNLDLLVSVPDFLVDRVLGHRLREFTIAVTRHSSHISSLMVSDFSLVYYEIMGKSTDEKMVPSPLNWYSLFLGLFYRISNGTIRHGINYRFPFIHSNSRSPNKIRHLHLAYHGSFGHVSAP